MVAPEPTEEPAVRAAMAQPLVVMAATAAMAEMVATEVALSESQVGPLTPRQEQLLAVVPAPVVAQVLPVAPVAQRE